jgi:hypothetical protein
VALSFRLLLGHGDSGLGKLVGHLMESVLPATKIAGTVCVVERKQHALSYTFERLAGLLLRS